MVASTVSFSGKYNCPEAEAPDCVLHGWYGENCLECRAEQMDDLLLLIDEWMAWGKRQFPHATAATQLAHLRQEVEELIGDPNDLMEYADVFALMLSALYSSGYSFEDLVGAMREKLVINQSRNWGPANEFGFVEHVRDERPGRPD